MSAAAPELLDADLSVTELIHAVSYTARVRGAADYRLLFGLSLIHERREDEYVAEVAALADRVPPVESGSISELRTPREKFGPNGLERAIGDVGAALCVTPQRARCLLTTAHAARYRLAETARTLAEGFIDLDRMVLAVKRTDLVNDEAIDRLDRELAAQIAHRGPMSTHRFQALIVKLIHQHDPEAIRRRTSRTNDDRNISIRPDRFTTGQARISGNLPQEQAALINARLDAMAKEVHKGDGRTLTQRRADAYVALAQGQQHLMCGCIDCQTARTAERGATAAQPVPASSAGEAASSAQSDACNHPTEPLMYVVVNLSTLLGLDNAPAYLDGQGLIDADNARRLVAEAKRAYVTPPQEDPDAAAQRYRPSRKLRALLHASELCCQFPGCNNPVSEADFDHHHAHRDGGKTVRGNIGPLCRFHHRLKTFGHWRQYQDLWHKTVFISPENLQYVGNAYSGVDIFDTIAANPPDRPPNHPSRSRFDRHRATVRTKQQQAQEYWERMNPPPF
ncbi:HNH endonuclease signature motif containing protein [Jongsikchunia kroppenstedtii]|uniref:HNH endonuclease signature motif containing protein n=1 Tax=Jongsikchunia kroppenstedtii TaxID=1121721 RepID=UPI00036E7883|nr:HNH endonuclease signature motif containing protein [Jongsikchunia kroppenstedtii]